MAKNVIGVDLGGTNIKAGLVSKQGDLLETFSHKTLVHQGREVIISRIKEAIRKISDITKTDISDVIGIGIGSPGPLDTRSGVILEPVNLPCLKNVPIVDIISKEFSLPVTLDNDANAACYGEFWVGAGKEVSSMVMLTLGTGIGGGIIIDNKLLRGTTDTGAEIGHMTINYDGIPCNCGNIGCLEVYASATATVRRFYKAVQSGRETILKNKILNDDEVTSKLIYEAALDGDELSVETIEQTGRFLGIGITSIIHTLDPERIVLSGGMIAAGNMLLDPLIEEMKKRTFPVPRERIQIRFAALGDDAGVIGAAGCLLAKLETSA